MNCDECIKESVCKYTTDALQAERRLKEFLDYNLSDIFVVECKEYVKGNIPYHK